MTALSRSCSKDIDWYEVTVELQKELDCKVLSTRLTTGQRLLVFHIAGLKSIVFGFSPSQSKSEGFM